MADVALLVTVVQGREGEGGWRLERARHRQSHRRRICARDPRVRRGRSRRRGWPERHQRGSGDRVRMRGWSRDRRRAERPGRGCDGGRCARPAERRCARELRAPVSAPSRIRGEALLHQRLDLGRSETAHILRRLGVVPLRVQLRAPFILLHLLRRHCGTRRRGRKRRGNSERRHRRGLSRRGEGNGRGRNRARTGRRGEHGLARRARAGSEGGTGRSRAGGNRGGW